jgi:hypothetical protein
VLVIALPPVRPSAVPPLRAVDPSQILCAGRPSLLLPAEGAPLVFGAELAHDFVLHVEPKSGPAIDLPATVDPMHGGFMVDTHAMQIADLDGEVTGILRGAWGFRSFDGPHYRLRASRPSQWIVASKDASALIVGREDILHLQSPDTCCVSQVTLKDEQGRPIDTEWKAVKADELEVKVPLQKATAGSVTMQIKKFGLREADEIPLHTYAEAGRLDSFAIHAGDAEGVLKGTRLDQVVRLEVDGIRFTPAVLGRAHQQDELRLTASNASVAKLHPGDAIIVRVALQDGRTLDLNSEVEAPRPKVSVLTKSVHAEESNLVRLGSADELPQEGRLNFSFKTQVPDIFPPGERIEVATADESFRVLLSVKDGNLTLQDSRTVLADLDPMKLLGPSAFGPLKFRPVSADHIEGDWQPLVNLVRIPRLNGIRCISAPERQCLLSGEKLFLLDSVSADPTFVNSVTVPEGFVDDALTIPPSKAKTLYIRLRDDPTIVDIATLPVLPAQQ